MRRARPARRRPARRSRRPTRQTPVNRQPRASGRSAAPSRECSSARQSGSRRPYQQRSRGARRAPALVGEQPPIPGADLTAQLDDQQKFAQRVRSLLQSAIAELASQRKSRAPTETPRPPSDSPFAQLGALATRLTGWPSGHKPCFLFTARTGKPLMAGTTAAPLDCARGLLAEIGADLLLATSASHPGSVRRRPVQNAPASAVRAHSGARGARCR
jgi:hypothetical protein